MRRSSSILLLIVSCMTAAVAWGQPNLVVTDITLASPPVAGVPNVATARLTNALSSTTPIFNIKWFLDGQEVGYGSHAPLGPGQTSGDNVFLRFTPGSSSFRVRYDADVDRHVSETDERDNSHQVLFLNGAREPLPDLIVEDLSFESTPRVGVQTTVTARLRNRGSVSTVGFNVKWFVDGREQGYGLHSPLGPGQISADNVRFVWTPSSTGSHPIRFEADVDGNVIESNELNGILEESAIVEGLPDLFVADVNFEAPPRIGVPVRVQAHLRNVGGSASGVFNIKWFQNGVEVGAGSHASLAAGATSNGNVYFTWTPAAAGTYRFGYRADVDGYVAESNESNNFFERPVTIAAPSFPDLVVDDISFSPAPRIGVQTVVTATLRNQGTLVAPLFNVKWFLDDSQVGYGSHRPLAAGATSTDNVRFFWTPSGGGVYRFRFEADVDRYVAESNENNNTREESVTVPGSASRVDARFSPSILSVNEDGWYRNNPVNVEVTLSCPATGGDCADSFSIISGTQNGARVFFTGHDAGPTGDVICESYATGGEFTHDAFVSQCRTASGILNFTLAAGESRTMKWFVWVQPSDVASFDVVATWGATSVTRTLAIPKANVHPLVFIHGILGSMPPSNLLVTSRSAAGDIFDPFLGSYRPLLDNLLKMGYEWDRTLFGIAYDWRNSNKHSGAYLARQLSGAVIPRSRDVSYVSRNGKADLVVHSMGGLVSRSYIQDFALDPTTGALVPYQGDVRKIVFIASPHKGFPSDYQTREGLTWEDYLYNAPFVSGTPFVMTVAMDGLIWPSLVEKKYDPTDAELDRDCLWVPRGTNPGLVPYFLYFPRLRNGVIGHFICTMEDIAPWSRDPVRGARSLFEMLPTEDLRPYLVAPGTGAPEPNGHEENTFLRDLNRTVDRLGTRLGPQNIFVIYGEGAGETDASYEVGPPGAKDWRYGTTTTERYTTAGDDLIPSVSTSLIRSGILTFNLPAGNEARLDAAPATPDGARHKEIVFHPATQRTWVPRYLTGADFPVSTPYSSPLVRLDTLISAISACPINLLVTDPQGRRLGYDPVSRTVLREIPNSIYTGPNAEPQILLIGDALPGAYRFTSTGYDSGPYLFRVDRVGASGPLPLAVFIGETSSGATAEETVLVAGNSPPGAVDDRFGIRPGETLSVAAPGVLENDVEVDSDPLAAILVKGPSHGDLRLESGGSFTYTPAPGFVGDDSFTYRATDGVKESGPARVALEIARPEVRAGSDRETTEGALVSFHGAFTPVDAASSHKVHWDFGDGATAEGALDPSHTYADDGSYPVTLSVTDNRVITGSDVLYVYVSNVAPVVEAGAGVSVDAGAEVSFSGSFVDPGASDTHEARWDFGDGGGSDGLAARHAYGAPGIYTASLLVRDDDGGEGTDSLTVEVRNVAPVVNAGPDADVEPGASVALKGSFTDPGNDSHEIVWDFGDGGKETGTLTPSHVFAAPGAYTVTLTVTDSHGASGSDTLQVRAQCRAAWIETFESYEPGADPEGWVDYEVSGGRLRSGSKVEGFRTASSGGDIVYRSVKSHRATEYRTQAALLWRNYELTGSLLVRDDSDEGHAIHVYTDLERGLSYQLRFDDEDDDGDHNDGNHNDDDKDDGNKKDDADGYRAFKGDRLLKGRSRSGFVPRDGVWYSFRVRVEPNGKKTRLRAKFWALEAKEPPGFQIDAEDDSNPLTQGAIGFSAEGNGLQLDDLKVTALGTGSRVSGDRDGDGICDGSDNCPSTKNLDQVDSDKDGVGDACDRCTARFEREKICLDGGYDERTGLSSSVVEIDAATGHLSSGGECGKQGHYRLASRSGLVLETPELPEDGLYRIQLQVSAERKHDGLDLEIEGKRLHVALQGDEPQSRFWWTRPILVRLSDGSHRVRVQSADLKPVDVEALRIEEVCSEQIGTCSKTPQSFCLDSRFDDDTGLSSYVREVRGEAGHSERQEDACGEDGYYYVAGKSGRLGVSFDVDVSAEYEVRFRYRVGSKGQEDESLRVTIGGEVFDFRDRDLVNSDRWETSPPLQVRLQAGSQWLELQSIGKDGVHLESVTLEPHCPVADTTPPRIVATVDPPGNAFGWHAGPATVSFECFDDGSGVAFCPAPVVVSSEGAGQVVSGTARDAAGNTASAEVKVSLDRTPPALQITSPQDGDTVGSTPLEIAGNTSDLLSGVADVVCGSAAGTLSGGSFSCEADLVSGDNALAVEVRDRAGNFSRATLSVILTAELEWPNASSRANSDPWIAAHHGEIRKMRPRLMVLNFVNQRSMDEMTAQVEETIAAFAEASRYHGYEDPGAPVFLQYELAYAVDLRDPSPPPGYPYRNSTAFPRESPTDGYWGFDYERLFSPEYTTLYGIPDPGNPSRLLGLEELIDRGLVHEVWIYGDADVPDVNAAEILELKPVYDENRNRIPGAMNRCAGNGCFDDEDDIPGERTVRIAFFNNTRGVGCLVHSLSHGMESIGAWNPAVVPYLSRYFTPFAAHDLNQRYGVPAQSWYACPGGDCLTYPSASSVSYNLPTGSGTIDPYDPVCGNVHFPPNARSHYDDVSPFSVLSSCTHYRDGSGALSPFTTADFQMYDTVAPDCQGGFLLWWRQNMPGLDNRALDDSGQPMLNWWPFLYY